MRKLLFIVVCFVLSSCGTIFGGKSQNISIMPADGSSGVNVEIVDGNGMSRSTLIPTYINVPRANKVMFVKVKESDCYKESQAVIDSKVNLFVILNIFGSWFSTTSTTFDSMTGAMWSYDENVIVPISKKKDCKK